MNRISGKPTPNLFKQIGGQDAQHQSYFLEPSVVFGNNSNILSQSAKTLDFRNTLKIKNSYRNWDMNKSDMMLKALFKEFEISRHFISLVKREFLQ